MPTENDVTVQVLAGKSDTPVSPQPANIEAPDPATAVKATAVDPSRVDSNGNGSSAFNPKTDAASGDTDIPLVTAMAADEKSLKDHGDAIAALQKKVDDLTEVTNAQTAKLNSLPATTGDFADADHVARVHRLMRKVFGED